MDGSWCANSSSEGSSAFPRSNERFSARDHVGKMPFIALTPLERVYDGCVGGFLAEKSRIHLRIASDGSLHGEVRRKQQQDALSSNGKKRRRRIIADHPDGFVIAHLIGNAQVVPMEEAVVSTGGCDEASTAEYCCAFEVTKRLHHMDRHTLTCHLHVPMAADAPALGTWRFFRTPDQEKHQLTVNSTVTTSNSNSRPDKQILQEAESEHKVFQLQPVQWYERQQEAEAAEREAAQLQSRLPSLLYPLRPGKYEFKGFTTYDMPSTATHMPRQRNGRRGRPRPIMTTVKDDCLVTLRLLPDGTLRGTSREVVQPQVCPLKGRWQANRVAYVLEYRVREAVGHFRYSGAVVIEEGSNGRRTKVQHVSNASSNGKRRETLSGKWNNVDEGHAEGYEGGRGEFELELIRVDFMPLAIKTEKIELPTSMNNSSTFKQEQVENIDAGTSMDHVIEIGDDDDAIHVLTSGDYDLSGCATDADGYEYAFDLKLQLRPGGKLSGQSKERIFQQTGRIDGRWEPSRIVYCQQYIVKNEVGVYTYDGKMNSDGAVVRGEWVNAEDESARARSEHGTFALVLVQSTRQWSTFSHEHYPSRFRKGVLTILMASARSNLLPVALWTHIFAFFNETWFTRP